MTTSYTVAELTTRLSETLAEAFADDVWVTGEIRDLSRSTAGHVYFQLVEPPDSPASRVGASLAVVLFDSNRRGVNAMLRRTGSVRMTDGVQVRIRAALDFYPPLGRLQLRMIGIDPFHTLGALEAERERVVRALAADGLLDRNGRLPYPSAPHLVGVVTSAGSAAHADFIDELTASGIGWSIVVADTRVQGRDAEPSIVAAIDALVGRGVDVIALVRGGGARTDLATFDAEAVVRAIATCPTPVITGIGHEVDASVADTVAARSFKTPTACAAALVTISRESLRRVEVVWTAITAGASIRLDDESERVRRQATAVAASTQRDLETGLRLTALAGHRLQREAGHALTRSTADLDRLAAGVAGTGRHLVRTRHLEIGRHGDMLAGRSIGALDRAARRLTGLTARTGVLDPSRALARGWSITRNPDGRIVRSTEGIDPSSQLVTTLADGEITSVVASVHPETTDQRGEPDG